jgi:hypothetical protein
MLTLLRLAGTVVAVALVPLALTPLMDRWRQRALRSLVPRVCGVLDAHHIDYWADFGTLLGFRRHADIIASDKDADLCIMAADKPRVVALAPAFAHAGMALLDGAGRSRRVLRIFDERTRYYVDIYAHTRDGDWLISELAPTENIPAALVERRIRAPFLGGSIRIPESVDAVLRYRYGDGYMTPRRGDKGIGRPYRRLRAVLEDIEAAWVGIWAWLRSRGA